MKAFVIDNYNADFVPRDLPELVAGSGYLIVEIQTARS